MGDGYLPGGIWQIQLSSPGGQVFQAGQVQGYRPSLDHGLQASRKCVRSLQATEPRATSSMSSSTETCLLMACMIMHLWSLQCTCRLAARALSQAVVPAASEHDWEQSLVKRGGWQEHECQKDLHVVPQARRAQQNNVVIQQKLQYASCVKCKHVFQQ